MMKEPDDGSLSRRIGSLLEEYDRLQPKEIRDHLAALNALRTRIDVELRRATRAVSDTPPAPSRKAA